MKKGMGKFLLVLFCIVIVVLFAVYSLNRRASAEIESKKIENIILSNSSNNSNILGENNSHFILYDGYEMMIKTGRQQISDMENTDENKEKYNINYYCFENGKKSNVQGEFGEETYEGYSKVSNVKKIAISEEYDMVPRMSKTLNKLPENLNLKLDYTDIEISEIDLDGDNKNEYIICYKIEDKKENISKSSVMLFNSNYQKIATLMDLDDGTWGGKNDSNDKVYITLENIEYIDIDKDGIMEIIIEEPCYEGTQLSVYKYFEDKLEGEINIEATLLP